MQYAPYTTEGLLEYAERQLGKGDENGSQYLSELSIAASLLVIARAAATWQAKMDERAARIEQLNKLYNRNMETKSSIQPGNDTETLALHMEMAV